MIGTSEAARPPHPSPLPRRGDTGATAINSKGVVAGVANSTSEGFIRQPDGSITTFTIPGGIQVLPCAINNHGTIAGTQVIGDGATRGFVRDAQGNVTTFAAPGAQITESLAMNDKGQIVGIAAGAVNNVPFSHGFLRDPDGTITLIDGPGAQQTEVHGINVHGEIAGDFINTAEQKEYGFVRDASGTLHQFTAPGAQVSQPVAIGATGKVLVLTEAGPYRLNRNGWVHQ